MRVLIPGVFILNLAARNESLKRTFRQRIVGHFPRAYVARIETEINEVLVCFPDVVRGKAVPGADAVSAASGTVRRAEEAENCGSAHEEVSSACERLSLLSPDQGVGEDEVDRAAQSIRRLVDYLEARLRNGAVTSWNSAKSKKKKKKRRSKALNSEKETPPKQEQQPGDEGEATTVEETGGVSIKKNSEVSSVTSSGPDREAEEIIVNGDCEGLCRKLNKLIGRLGILTPAGIERTAGTQLSR